MSIIVNFRSILVSYGNFGQLWSIKGHFTLLSCCFLVTFSVFLVNLWSIICQFLGNFLPFFPQFFYKMFCQFNYLLNYCWKSIVKSIIFSIIAWCGLVEPGFELSINPSLDSEGEGLSRFWTAAYNWPIRGSVSDPCPCLLFSAEQCFRGNGNHPSHLYRGLTSDQTISAIIALMCN